MRHLAPHHFLPDGAIKRWSLEPHQVHMVLCSWWHIRPSLSGLHLCASYTVSFISLVLLLDRASQIQSWNFSGLTVSRFCFSQNTWSSSLSDYHGIYELNQMWLEWEHFEIVQGSEFWGHFFLIDQRRDIIEHHNRFSGSSSILFRWHWFSWETQTQQTRKWQGQYRTISL